MSENYISPNDTIAKRNVAILIFIQATIGCMIPVHFLLGGLAGKNIAPVDWLATLPISMTIIGGMLSTPIHARNFIKYGRPIAFIFATLMSVIGCALCAFSITTGNFVGLNIGALLIGFFMSAQGFFRFAAIDMATSNFRARAISLSILGGLAAGVIGPRLAGQFSVPNMELPYLIMAVIALVLTASYLALKLPLPKDSVDVTRPNIWPLLRYPKIQAAILISITSYAMMNLMMTSTPLAVEGCGFTREDSAAIVSMHVVAMFAPSFITGELISRFGIERVTFSGLVILLFAGVAALIGIELANFYVALVLLGIGWNFSFIGGTALLAKHVEDPKLAQRLQEFNDTTMWCFVAIASLSSGLLMNYFGDGSQGGWNLVSYALLTILIIAMIIGGLLLHKASQKSI